MHPSFPGSPFPPRAPGTLDCEHHPRGGKPGFPGSLGPGQCSHEQVSVSICGRQEAKSALTGALDLPTWRREIGPFQLLQAERRICWDNEVGGIRLGLLFHVSACLLDPLCGKVVFVSGNFSTPAQRARPWSQELGELSEAPGRGGSRGRRLGPSAACAGRPASLVLYAQAGGGAPGSEASPFKQIAPVAASVFLWSGAVTMQRALLAAGCVQTPGTAASRPLPAAVRGRGCCPV